MTLKFVGPSICQPTYGDNYDSFSNVMGWKNEAKS